MAAEAARAVMEPADLAETRIASTVWRPRSTPFTLADTSLAMVLSAMLPPTEIDTALFAAAARARLADSAWTVTAETSWAETLALAAWIPGVAPIPSPSIVARVARPMLFIAKVPPMVTAPALSPEALTPAAIAAMLAVMVFPLVASTDSAPVALTVVSVSAAETLARPFKDGVSLTLCFASS
ncbi:hypothetical protein CHKEEEPN_1627 [Methylorubrum podarium]|nr:hypothetical protein CHKEEEPN_1627 [Methylorubrum podarium]